MSSGGEGPGPTRSWTFLQARQTLLKEAFAPLADDLTPGVQATGDVIVGQSFRRVEDHLGPKDLIIRQRILDHPTFEFGAFLRRELYLERAGSRHMAKMPEEPEKSRHNTCVYL